MLLSLLCLVSAKATIKKTVMMTSLTNWFEQYLFKVNLKLLVYHFLSVCFVQCSWKNVAITSPSWWLTARVRRTMQNKECPSCQPLPFQVTCPTEPRNSTWSAGLMVTVSCCAWRRRHRDAHVREQGTMDYFQFEKKTKNKVSDFLFFFF